MIDMTIDMTASAPTSHNHFHGNGNCDAMREANHRADRATGMESEIAPYYGNARGAQTQSVANGAAPSGGMAGRAMAQNGGETAMAAYDNAAYAAEHEWSAAAEEGMSSPPQDSFTEPLSADEAARNSWRALLARNVGRNVLVRFLMGTQNFITVEGELYEVGTDYIVIYQPLWDSHITADLYSVKFVEFREPPGQMLG